MMAENIATLPLGRNQSAGGSPPIVEGRLRVDPALATTILLDMNYPGQRPATAPHIAFLADHMQRGTFRGGTQIAFARIADRYFLVNGQHRLRAIQESGVTVEFQVLVTDAASEADLPAIYYTFDRGARARSDAEVLASVGIAEKYGVTKTTARAVFQAYPLLSSGFTRAHFTADPTGRNDDIRLAASEPWWPYAARFESMIGGAPTWVRKRLANAQGVAAGMVTIKYQAELAEQFWRGLSADDGLRRDDPRKALLNDLAGREWSRKSAGGCLVIAYAWNAFFESRKLTHVKIVANARLRFAGTPIGRAR